MSCWCAASCAGFGESKHALKCGILWAHFARVQVDDEKLSRMIISNQLQRCGYNVTAVGSGEEALELVKKENGKAQHKLVLSDVAMPGVNGPDLLQAIRSSSFLQDVPVVMMSAHEQMGTVFECVRRGAEDYILKPVTLKQVRNLWQHVYRRQSGLRTDGYGKPDGSKGSDDEDGGDHALQSLEDGLLGTDAERQDTDLYTAEEMRTHCKTQIERYKRVIEVIDNHPELFPGGSLENSEQPAAKRLKPTQEASQ